MTQDQDNHEATGDPFWIRGEFLLRVHEAGLGPAQTLRIHQPFALIGRAPDADVRINDRGVSSRHAYLHLDRRGLFVIDLLSRSGTHFPGSSGMAGWLTPGDWVEVDGRRIELVQIEVDGHEVSPAPCAENPLAKVRPGTLLPVSLDPVDGSGPSWTLGSELTSVGRSPACGIHLNDESIAKVQGVIYRTPSAAYLVNLFGHTSLNNGRQARRARRLRQGQRLTIGSTTYVVRIAAQRQEIQKAKLPARKPEPSPDLPLVARVIQPEIEERTPALLPPDANTPESRDALVAWLAESFHETRNQNAELQSRLVALLQEMQRDNASLIQTHLSRMEAMEREIASLRSELAQQTSLSAPTGHQPQALPAPAAAPLRIARPEADSKPADPASAANWLLERASQVDDFEQEDQPLWLKWFRHLTRNRPH